MPQEGPEGFTKRHKLPGSPRRLAEDAWDVPGCPLEAVSEPATSGSAEHIIDTQTMHAQNSLAQSRVRSRSCGMRSAGVTVASSSPTLLNHTATPLD